MIATERNAFQSFLEKHTEADWSRVLQKLVPSIHAVDQVATRIWFSFWPLKLTRSLHQAEDPRLVVRQFLLDGEYRLEVQVDSSVEYFYGARFWPEVKRTVLAFAEKADRPEGTPLERQIRQIAGGVAARRNVPESVVLGISAVGVMCLQQVGLMVLAEAAEKRASQPVDSRTPEQVLKARNSAGRPGMFGFLHKIDRKFCATFDESRPDGTMRVIQGQDLSMASSFDTRDFKDQDPRRIAGPIPAQCRSGACGYCWVGVFGGKENISPMTPFERRRLKYFGYTSAESDQETHPHIRLSCQSRCFGNVSIVVPSWNGVLDGRD